MNTTMLHGVVLAAATIAGIAFIVVAVHEFDYAGAHPYAYGPAKVIAWGAAAGALLAFAVALLAYTGARSTTTR